MRLLSSQIWKFALAFPALAGALEAQQADLSQVPPPRPPLVASMPKDAQWTVTIKPEPTPSPKEKKDDDQAPPENPKEGPGGVTEIRSTKSGKVKRDVLVYKQGSSRDFWFVGNYILTLRSNKKSYAVVDAASMIPGDEIKGVYREAGKLILSPGFPGMDWIQMKYYDQVVLLDKKIVCYHYVLKGSVPEIDHPVIGAEAWIDAATGLPVRYTAAGLQYDYKFGPAPSEPLVLPPPYTHAFDNL